MWRLGAFAALVLAAFAVPVPFLDRAGVALVGFACLALATPRRPRSLVERVMGQLDDRITLPTEDAGKTPPSLRARLEPYGVAGGSAEFAYAQDDEA